LNAHIFDSSQLPRAYLSAGNFIQQRAALKFVYPERSGIRRNLAHLRLTMKSLAPKLSCFRNKFIYFHTFPTGKRLFLRRTSTSISIKVSTQQRQVQLYCGCGARAAFDKNNELCNFVETNQAQRTQTRHCALNFAYNCLWHVISTSFTPLGIGTHLVPCNIQCIHYTSDYKVIKLL
jgi:hypothetical protein